MSRVAPPCGLVHAVRQFFDARYEGALTQAVVAGPAVVVLVSLSQGVRGSGLALPYTDRRSDRSLNLCAPAATPDSTGG
ncbi:hypothetical protein RM572_11905 [Streptomyces sp. DSM 42041]|uniref:Uncharacterized protein n=1 Tax=Streptomyces hazeniae TaxID=3075538 RepID=A0ABU2NR62_9ACTN|nr:hypothetical protein [Streptomyces sp. DSM 42041]MDT0379469.1 hypothetical protein [Streptomyces sp. DSM 42041]